MSHSIASRPITIINNRLYYTSLPSPPVTSSLRIERPRKRSLDSFPRKRRPRSLNSRDNAHAPLRYRNELEYLVAVPTSSAQGGFTITESTETYSDASEDDISSQSAASVPSPIPGAFPPIEPSIASRTTLRDEVSSRTCINEPARNRVEVNLSPPFYTLEQSEINERIRTRLESHLTPREANYMKLGYVYIFRESSRPGLLKIGTSEMVWKRKRSIGRACGLVIEVLHCSTAIFGAYRAEKLIHDELSPFNERYACAKCVGRHHCPVNHGEWFRVSFDHALLAVEKWTGFLKMRPYGRDCKLEGFWKDRLWSEQYMTQIDRLSHDFTSLQQQWQEFVNVKRLDRLRYQWRSVSQKICTIARWIWNHRCLSLIIFSVLLVLMEHLFQHQFFYLRVLHLFTQLTIYLKPQPQRADAKPTKLPSPQRYRSGTSRRRSSG